MLSVGQCECVGVQGCVRRSVLESKHVFECVIPRVKVSLCDCECVRVCECD